MIRVMFDTDDLGVLRSLRGVAPFLATYSDLLPDLTAFDALQAELMPSKLLLFDRALGDPTGLASLADVEPGAMTIGQLPAWKDAKVAAGIPYPTGYCDRNDLPAVLAIVRTGLWHMVATLDGTSYISGWQPAHGPAVIQILGEQSLGFHADMSIILEDRWHPDVR